MTDAQILERAAAILEGRLRTGLLRWVTVTVLRQAAGEMRKADNAKLRERLEWTCEGCGGRLVGGQPPRCIGCRRQPARRGKVGP